MICPHCHTDIEVSDTILKPDIKIQRKHFELATWQDIADEIRNGYAYRVIDVGDIIETKLRDGTEVAIEVAGIEEYADNEAIFCFRDVLFEARMNDEATNEGCFAGSKMANKILPEVLDKLPDELRRVLKPMRIRQVIPDGRRQGDYSCSTLLSLFSAIEVFGESFGREYVFDVGDKQMPIFKKRSGRIRTYRNLDNGTAWWLRSPATGSSNSFYVVYSYGSSSSYNAGNAYGVLPCFTI